MNQEEIPEWAPCGHEECAQSNRERSAVAKMLGIQDLGNGMGYVATDPEAAIAMIRYMSGGHEAVAKDVIAQLEHLANTHTTAPPIEGETVTSGRSEAAKRGRRSLWEAVKGWATRRRTN